MLWTRGLQGLWRLENSAVDSSGNGRTATLVGSPSYVAGRFGRGLSLNGTTNYVTLPASSTLIPTPGAVTITVHFKTTDAANDLYIVSTRRAVAGSFLSFSLLSTGKVRWVYPSIGTVGVMNGAATVNDGNWHFASFVKDGNVNTGYIDEVQDATVTQTYDITPSADVAQICHLGAWAGINGSGDEVAFWSRALGASDRKRVMMGMGPVG